ncbi:hypothetical protein N7493_001551 [Penicillium malachiteum]|uniref:Uncharacterized protein n=1 Tax=Penicillium malachiteum TaxID=1324776 RepID=A0AAD6HUG0_9EURO|nr:hypothetical protein N7493_001551 [Penicillium malachiteum]
MRHGVIFSSFLCLVGTTLAAPVHSQGRALAGRQNAEVDLTAPIDVDVAQFASLVKRQVDLTAGEDAEASIERRFLAGVDASAQANAAADQNGLGINVATSDSARLLPPVKRQDFDLDASVDEEAEPLKREDPDIDLDASVDEEADQCEPLVKRQEGFDLDASVDEEEG